MPIGFKMAPVASALLLAVVSLPGVAGAQATPQAPRQDCVRRVAPPSSAPHELFRRTVCVPRSPTTLSEGCCRQRCQPVAEPRATPQPPSTGPSRLDQGAL